MSLVCVVVAEQSRARFFIQAGAGKTLRELADLTNPEGRLHEQDLLSDRPGRSFDSKGTGRHAMEPKMGAKKHSAIRFAQEICTYLETNRDEYDKLILIAPPEFLGLLRGKLPDALAQLVSKEINKDIVRKDIKEIQQYLKK